MSMAEEVRAEMVASVFKVLVSQGDTVSEGDELVTLESMKMEIPVIAEISGVVREIAVSEGDVIQGGDLIAIIE
jgi:acetyl-CoA carboxylase biotin carboxyl carrier protein